MIVRGWVEGKLIKRRQKEEILEGNGSVLYLDSRLCPFAKTHTTVYQKLSIYCILFCSALILKEETWLLRRLLLTLLDAVSRFLNR